MPAAHRLTDVCTGHSCYPSRPICIGLETIIINNLNATHSYDPDFSLYETHCCGPACHDSPLREGSETVWYEGAPACRIGDKVMCDDGCYADTGSPDTFIGGPPFEI